LASGNRFALPQLHQTTTIKCPVNLNKNSLQLVPCDPSNKSKYRVQFMLDCTERCTARVYFLVTETSSKKSSKEFGPIFEPPRAPSAATFPRGLEQFYEQPTDQALDVSRFTEEELTYNSERSYYPVAIVLQAASGTEDEEVSSAGSSSVAATGISTSALPQLDAITVRKDDQTTPPTSSATSATKLQQHPSTKKVTCQVTYGALIHCSDDTYVVKPLKQKIWCEGKSYIIHEIFGLENGENETGRECVICMTDPRDSTVLPCRHMCLCSTCAEALRQQTNKCPICRSTVKHIIQIKVSSNKPQEVDKSAAEDASVPIDEEQEDSLVLKKKNKQASS